MSPGGPLRVDCPHAERCAGCPLIDLSYPEQLARKRERLAASLAAYPALGAIVVGEARGADPVTGYRTRAKWMVGRAGGGGAPALGLYTKSGEHEVMDIPGCRVVTPLVALVGEALRALLRAPPAGAGWLRSPGDGGALEAVDLREVRAEGEGARALVTLVVSDARAPSLEQARAAAAELGRLEPGVAGVAVNRRRGGAPQVLGPETEWVWGERELRDRVGESTVLATFGSFVQAHRGQSARLHAALGRALPAAGEGGARVLDLYGGSGAIALALAARGARVDLVESFAPAAAAAGRAAALSGRRVRALSGDAAQVAGELLAQGERYDLVVVNPPRRGLSPAVREAVAGLGPPRVAYVSCDPRTLARDLDHLLRLGYAASGVDPYDMIPLTAEIESLALLERGPLPAARVLHDAGSAVFVEKGAHEPTTPQGEHAVSLLDRVRLVPGLEMAVPVHRLDVGTSGVCLFARAAAEVHPWALALGAGGAVKTYLAGVKGVASPRGVVKRPLKEGGKMIAACTRYRRLAVAAGHSLLAVRPEQGRTHQIRRHLAGIGHAVLGDERYGDPATARHFAERHALDRTFLHCLSIELDHPATGERVRVLAGVPADLGAVPGFAEASRNAERDFAIEKK